MLRSELLFERPEALAAREPAASRGRSRDGGRLLVSTAGGHEHARFVDLARFLRRGDLLVVNHSATLRASLPARAAGGAFILNLSTDYGGGLWLAEPRHSPAQPGPVSHLAPGDKITAAGLAARLVAPYPSLPRLWFVRFGGDVREAMRRRGAPIRYGYAAGAFGLEHYQTMFAQAPGSAEMPSAAYPFTRRVVDSLQQVGVELAGIVLHTGVSSLEVETEEVEAQPLYPEPFCVPATTAAALNAARAGGRRVVAVGTTVVRALESAWNGRRVQSRSGFTRLYLHPRRGPQVVAGLLTGLHDPVTSHLAMLYALAGRRLIREAYAAAVEEGYRWHEFGDSHLILP